MSPDDLGATLLQEMPDGLIVSDRAGVTIHWNRGAERIFGYAAAEALCALFLDRELRPETAIALRDSRKRGRLRRPAPGPPPLRTARGFSRDGSPREFQRGRATRSGGV